MSSIYTFCPNQKPIDIYNIGNIDGNYLDFRCNTPAFEANCYYKLKRRKYALFNIYFIEGIWLKMNYDMNDNRLSSNFRLELLDYAQNPVQLYYLLECNEFIELNTSRFPGVKKWKDITVSPRMSTK